MLVLPVADVVTEKEQKHTSRFRFEVTGAGVVFMVIFLFFAGLLAHGIKMRMFDCPHINEEGFMQHPPVTIRYSCYFDLRYVVCESLGACCAVYFHDDAKSFNVTKLLPQEAMLSAVPPASFFEPRIEVCDGEFVCDTAKMMQAFYCYQDSLGSITFSAFLCLLFLCLACCSCIFYRVPK